MRDVLELSPGDIFAESYRIVRPLRSGGMGRLYVVVQIATNKLRVLKLLIPQLVSREDSRTRFLREARAASAIDSDHVVDVVTAGVDAVTDAPYIVMELLDGQDLSELVEGGGPVPFEDVRLILTHVGHALERAHLQGIIHRDLKPENIFLALPRRAGERFTAKVVDFGVAKFLSEGLAQLGTQPVGSPLFMAPEQTDPHGRIGAHTDVWALGLLAYYLLTGSYYWLVATCDVAVPVLLREVCFDALEPPSARALRMRAREVPPGFDAWFERCVCRDIDARYRDGGEAVAAFLRDVTDPSRGDDDVPDRVSADPDSARQPTVKADDPDVSSLVIRDLLGSGGVDPEPGPPSSERPLVDAADPAQGARARDGLVPWAREAADDPADPPTAALEEAAVLGQLMPGARDSAPATVLSLPDDDSDLWVFEPTGDPEAFFAGESLLPATTFRSEPEEGPADLAPALAPPVASALEPGALPESGSSSAPSSSPAPSSQRATPVPHTVPVPPTASQRGRLFALLPAAIVSLGLAAGISSGLAIGLRPVVVTASADPSSPAALPERDPRVAPPASPLRKAPGPQEAPDDPRCSAGMALASPRGPCVGRAEVTVREYEACVRDGACPALGATPRAARAAVRAGKAALCNGSGGYEDHPVNCVAQPAAATYCTWSGARLPSALEWTTAWRGHARGIGDATNPTANACRWECAAFWVDWGLLPARPLDGDDGYSGTSPAWAFRGKQSTSPLLDLDGNVAEWVSDQPAPDLALALGSSFASTKIDTNEPDRLALPLEEVQENVGFRCAADPKAAP